MERGGSGMERVVAVRVGRQCGQRISVGRQHVEGGRYALLGLACRWSLWVCSERSSQNQVGQGLVVQCRRPAAAAMAGGGVHCEKMWSES